MTEPAYDLLIRGGRVATASDVFEADVAIAGKTIAAIGRRLPGGRREIDARGKLVLPGDVDSHAHIEQLSAAGIVNADTFESATVSAAFGGTTSVVSFAAQHVGMKLPQVLEEYHALARSRHCGRRQTFGRSRHWPLPGPHGRRGGEADRTAGRGYGSGAEFRGAPFVICPPRCVRIER